MKHFLAFDLGASSGRAILGSVGDGKVSLEEMHRFSNGPIEIEGHLYWNLLGLFDELKTGLRKALESGVVLSGMAVDTWGVDFALIDKDGAFLGFPNNYRDPRTNDIYPYVFSKVPREELYARTGIQFMNFNTLFQLAAMERDGVPALGVADRMLMMPNALTYLLSGNVSAEYTIATTGQAYDPDGKDWAWDIIEKLDLPKEIFPPIADPCTVVGELRSCICEELNCDPIPVILVGSHDTASAVAAVPADGTQNWAYLSSGTWSLLGVELDEPLMTSAAMAANYTNEGGIAGKIRFLKNIMGLWLIQESRNEWKRRGENYSFDELADMAMASEPFRSLVDPNDESFVAPGDMPTRIADYCRKTNQPVPETPGQIVRTAFESLALRYRQTILEIEDITGQKIDVLHLVGGGSKDEVLNQFTADAIQCPVVTGPVEATAIGNIIGQALAVGAIPDLVEARSIVRNSTDLGQYVPQGAAEWERAYARYRSLVP
ncbi:MAG: rhamnulokinase [Lentisphaerae bacterium]|jgi:rhamnulokinase|nr:rhamnulokinase [Lentisphaerota bacterium]MBT4821566.1 rhamnulokinase [Lentisphaerota bacterium]MBT5604556.1 rhamnulokinase [Lentisphaerota bacterium]MBT7061729.1 rhamnulokinase [Lentisphaerota bacterium]